MSQEKSGLQKRIESGKRIVLAEIAPPKSPDGAQVKSLAKKFVGKVDALGVSDNRDDIRMSALAAASLIVNEGVEPVLHMATRDRNRAALSSDCLGASALGIRNILCTSGTHQTLLPFYTAKNVYDIDATLLLKICKDNEKNGGQSESAPLCLGAVASPYADPIELQLPRLAQKILIGAQFVITQPLFDLERFNAWWKEIQNRGLHEKAAFVAGIRILTQIDSAKAFAEKRPLPLIPDTILQRLSTKSNAKDCRKEGIAIALETIERLEKVEGLRGFEIVCEEDPEACVEVLEKLH
jgi:methylenetetrahydrofolate reductase (NADPH)